MRRLKSYVLTQRKNAGYNNNYNLLRVNRNERKC